MSDKQVNTTRKHRKRSSSSSLVDEDETPQQGQVTTTTTTPSATVTPYGYQRESQIRYASLVAIYQFMQNDRKRSQIQDVLWHQQQ